MQRVSQAAPTLGVCSEQQCCSEASLLSLPAYKALAWFTVWLWSTWITSLMDSRLGGQANDVMKLILPHRRWTKQDPNTNCLVWMLKYNSVAACLDHAFHCSFKALQWWKWKLLHKYVYAKRSLLNRWMNDTVYVFLFSISVFRLFYRWSSPLTRVPKDIRRIRRMRKSSQLLWEAQKSLAEMCNGLWIEMAQRVSTTLLPLAPAGFWPSTSVVVQKIPLGLWLCSA